MSDELHSDIVALASTLSGAAETALPFVEQLCTASEQAWEARLRPGITPTDCRSCFLCAAAFSALAVYQTSQGSDVSSFSAGSVSVQKRTVTETAAAAEDLRRQAERLMAPWVVPDDFAFRGVRPCH